MLAVNHVTHLMKFTWRLYAFYSPFCSCMSPVCWYFHSVACGDNYRLPSYPVFRKCKTLVTAYRLHRTSENKTKKNRQVFYFRHDSRHTESDSVQTGKFMYLNQGSDKRTTSLLWKTVFEISLHIFIWIDCPLLDSYYKKKKSFV